jgi:transketolase
MNNTKNIQEMAKWLRLQSLAMTTYAGSGHPTSCLSLADVVAIIALGGYFHLPTSSAFSPDRLVFSKGHASALYYAMYAAAGLVPIEELQTYRKLGSRLEGHPTMKFPYAEAPTGSLGQGLSIGLGLALGDALQDKNNRTWVVLGDSEMAEGSNWEAAMLASAKGIKNLVAIVDVNGLGQRGATMWGEGGAQKLHQMFSGFGWEARVVDGHNVDALTIALDWAVSPATGPRVLLCQTTKGQGVSFLANKEGWHGKVLSTEQLVAAQAEIGESTFVPPQILEESKTASASPINSFTSEAALVDDESLKHSTGLDRLTGVATRFAVGEALADIASTWSNTVYLDPEVRNSSGMDAVYKRFPKRVIETYIAEQNTIGMMVGLSRAGYYPITSGFAAFWTRAHDQLRMAMYAGSDMLVVGSHAGISIGEDGSSQMGLEDIGLFRGLGATVLYPSDARSAYRLTQAAVRGSGTTYIRATREPLPDLYDEREEFSIGGSKVLRSSDHDSATIIASGVMLHEAIQAYEMLKEDGVLVRVVDLYSINPIDEATLRMCAAETKRLIVVEDHRAAGGIGEAVLSVLGEHLGRLGASVLCIAVHTEPMSGTPSELRALAGIDAAALVQAVRFRGPVGV